MDISKNKNSTVSDTWDKEKAITRLGGEASLLQKLATLFLRDTPLQLAEIELGIRLQDYEQAFIPAHSLKGTSCNFCTFKLESYCQQAIEQLKAEDWIAADAIYQNMIEEYRKLEVEFQCFINS